MEYNTVQYWLNKAKEEGYEWADAALENAKAQCSLEIIVKSTAAALFRAFDWSKTSQGLDYWCDIHISIQQ